MAITITANITTDGHYSVYYPISITATSNNGSIEFIEFVIKDDGGNDIGLPAYYAPQISSQFTFNAALYLQSIFEIQKGEYLNVSSVTEVTNLYGKFEIELTEIETDGTRVGASTTTSNEFWAYPSKNRKIDATYPEQTNYIPIKDLGVMLTGTTDNTHTAYWLLGSYVYDRPFVYHEDFNVTFWYEYSASYWLGLSFVKGDGLMPGVNQSTHYLQPSSSFDDQLIVIPLREAYITANDLLSNTIISDWEHLYVTITSPTSSKKMRLDIIANPFCNYKVFKFVNEYGCEESIVCRLLSKNIKTRSSKETIALNNPSHRGYYDSHGTTLYDLSGETETVIIDSAKEYTVESQYYKSKAAEHLIHAFVSSPKHWVKEEEGWQPVLINNGSFDLIRNNKGTSIKFNYKLGFV